MSFYLQVQREGSWAVNDFRPTPIPLNEWRPHYDRREGRAGTLHETIQTEAPLSVAAVPAHYWEDALRHSVYLTLVRDKIDQLIAKGDVITPDSKEHHASKEVDDHDLWEKIKTAPFDRKPDEEPVLTGDVTIMARGRLMEEHGGFRFAEDETSKEKCGDEKCSEGVKAFWSVKRVRQRETETSPGNYHYELTFSVVSQTPKKPKKPYDNPVRTFTVRESVPEKVVEMPQEHGVNERTPPQTARPERAIWLHKNIIPYYNHHHYHHRQQARQYQHGLDRLFSSLFSDEDEAYEPPRYRPHPHVQTHPQYSQFAKVGYVGSPSDQQKRLTPYPYKPHSYKYSRPLPPPPQYMQHHYVDGDNIGVVNNPYQQEHRYVPTIKLGKPTRPSVLPTAPVTVQTPKNWTADGEKNKPNGTDSTTKVPEPVVHKNYSKPRPAPMKINYLPDHVRPPIYNAPPGVFVTMDKKPFKPMPPLKLLSKPLKSHKPVDFRPSPQVLDMQQFSEPDPLFDSAFKPITWNYSDTNTTEKIEVAESSTQVSNNTHNNNNTRKPNPKGKKPPKKHENIKAQRITTSAPEIITASSDSAEEEIDALQWANVVGAFTKTTPMEPQKDKSEDIESTTPLPTTTTVSSTTPRRRVITTTTEAFEETTTTTHKPPKRTRPPPKFTKPEKIKKHKRITTTTTKAPARKTTADLTPQASSAAATKPFSSVLNKTQSTTTSSTTTTTSTTTRPITTTTKATTTQSVTTASEPHSSTTQPKIKNRFRQSTLMQKGTSVNHDKWSVSNTDKTRTVLPLAGKFPPRRKGSNFQGYISSTPRMSDIDDNDHEDHAIFSTTRSTTTTELTTVRTTKPTTPTYEDTADQYEGNSESSDYSTNHEEDIDVDIEHEDDEGEEDTQDHKEFIFHVTSTMPSEKTNEIIEQDHITTEQIITSPHAVPKNKTKCKKKTQNSTSSDPLNDFKMLPTTTSTESPAPSILEELFGGFTLDAATEKESNTTPKPELEEQESENHQQFVKIDDDLQDFLDSLKEGDKNVDGEDQYDEEDDESESLIDEEEALEDDEDTASARDSDYRDRPFSLLELMAME